MPGRRVVAIEVTAPSDTTERRYSVEVLAQGGKHRVAWRNEATSKRLTVLGLCAIESLQTEPNVWFRPFLAGEVGWRWERGYTPPELRAAAPRARWLARLRTWLQALYDSLYSYLFYPESEMKL